MGFVVSSVTILAGVIGYLIVDRAKLVDMKDPIAGFTLDIVSDSSSRNPEQINRSALSWVLTRIGYEKGKPVPLIKDIGLEYPFDSISSTRTPSRRCGS